MMTPPELPGPPLSIGAVSERSGFSTSTLRYYESIGLLPQAPRASGRRRYPLSTLNRLGVIRLAQEAGLTLDEIRELLDGFPPRTRAAQRWKRFADAKLRALDEQAQRIERMRSLFSHLMGCECSTLEECATRAATRTDEPR